MEDDGNTATIIANALGNVVMPNNAGTQVVCDDVSNYPSGNNKPVFVSRKRVPNMANNASAIWVPPSAAPLPMDHAPA